MDPVSREKKDIEQLIEKIEKIEREVQQIKEQTSKKHTKAPKIGDLVQDTLKETLKLSKDLPKKIEKEVEGILSPEGLPLYLEGKEAEKDFESEEVETQIKNIKQGAEGIKKQAKKKLGELKKEVWKEVRDRLDDDYSKVSEEKIKSEIEEDLQEILQETEDEALKLSQKLNRAVEKGVSGARKNFQERIRKYVKDLDLGKTADILSVLASPERLQILRLLDKKGRYYTELEEALGIGPSSLRHHLGKLKSAELVYQERSRGKYLITQKGKNALLLSAYLGRFLTP